MRSIFKISKCKMQNRWNKPTKPWEEVQMLPISIQFWLQSHQVISHKKNLNTAPQEGKKKSHLSFHS